MEAGSRGDDHGQNQLPESHGRVEQQLFVEKLLGVYQGFSSGLGAEIR